MFVAESGLGRNKLRQERHGDELAAAGTTRWSTNMPLLTELGRCSGGIVYRHGAPTELALPGGTILGACEGWPCACKKAA